MRSFSFWVRTTLIVALGTLQAMAFTWIPHYTQESGDYVTDINVINPDFRSTHALQLLPYAADGTLLSDHIVNQIIQPGARVVLDRATLGWSGVPVSHVFVGNSGSVRVIANYRANRPGALIAPVPSTETVTQARFIPQIDAGWFDGLAVVNSWNEPRSFVLSAHDSAGNTLRSTRIELVPNGKWQGLPRDLLDGLPDASGYIQVISEFDLAILGLRGSIGSSSVNVLTQIALDTANFDQPSLDYSNQISRIIDRKCTSCHHIGGIAPFSLETYDDVKGANSYLYDAVATGTMPPWQPNKDCKSLEGDISLDPLEKEYLLSWLVDLAPAGHPARTPAPTIWPDAAWDMGEPDQVGSYTEDYLYEPGPDVYRCFPIPLNNSQDKQIQAMQILPGNPEIVHHVLIFASDNGFSQDLDTAEAGPGYTCFGGPGNDEFRLLATWAPGASPLILPDEVGMTLTPNTTLIMQVHYHYGTTGGADRTQVGLYFSNENRPKELVQLPLVNQDFVIPPNENNYLVTEQAVIPFGIDVELYALMPHMHLLGKSIWVETIAPFSSETDCLIDIPRWDFNWQRTYFLKEKLTLRGGTTIKLSCLFDNTAENPSNPYNPPQPVGWGEATTDEMALSFLGMVLPFNVFKSAAYQELVAQFQFKDSRRSADLPPTEMIQPFLKPAPGSCCSQKGEVRPWCDTLKNAAPLSPASNP